MRFDDFVFFVVFNFAIYSPLQALPEDGISETSSSFSLALDALQHRINYTFENIGLLRRAMTHSSFSNENNKALSILGESVIETLVAKQSLTKDIDISANDLNDRVAEMSGVESPCATEGVRLGLEKIIRVALKTDPTVPSVVCGAFRALLAAIVLDTGKLDGAAGDFWRNYGGIGNRRSLAI